MTSLPSGDDVSSPANDRYAVSAMSSAGPAAEALGRRATPEQEAAAVEHLQRAKSAAARSRRIPEGVTGREVESAVVLGFGTMGRGIAMSFAAAGIPVVVFEASDGAWTRGEAAVGGSLARAVSRGKIEAGRQSGNGTGSAGQAGSKTSATRTFWWRRSLRKWR